MKITLVGMGGGTFDSVTMRGAEVLHEATLIIGAKRLLENLPDFCTQNRIAMYKIGEILSVLETTKEQNIALVYSGDTGFYSGASALCRVLDERQIEYTVIPGVSSCFLLPSTNRGRTGTSSPRTAVHVTLLLRAAWASPHFS